MSQSTMVRNHTVDTQCGGQYDIKTKFKQKAKCTLILRTVIQKRCVEMIKYMQRWPSRAYAETSVSMAYTHTKYNEMTVLNDRQYDTEASQPVFKTYQTKRTLAMTVLNDRQYDTEASQPVFKTYQTKRTRVQARQTGKMKFQLLSSLIKAAAYMYCSVSDPKNEKRTRSSKARAKAYRVEMKTESIHLSISTSNKDIFCNININYIIMVVSKRVNSAVNTASTFS